ncbi:pyruvate kinase [Flammeovirga yaeyamensis]|uniref:Pyruvate kinase n=1 Tax=Flammeovirga yaeyamensis TaxID=367791 RepID=A0AAX1N2P9_9BACT|nr:MULTISPECIES: pyruvate kinase [Flammeovirga]ANQ48470.1 pyruvate kinase [Flammeovirga sp. MY04]MBB3696374.1 pyruvate kinase [Flammeovirga yaeyamensis]NMF35053.1 pyruvate kinase [Flammeovirga yaeyamensis]QWG00123.1 pyruvate kinase [Flammeovirga yaeyamensis]
MSIAINKTKIVATIGPATRDKQKILELIHAGADVFRLNFSHDVHEAHQQVIDWVAEYNSKFGHNTAILQDLQGPKIRIGEVEGGAVEIVEGEQIIITNTPVVGTKDKVSTTYTNIVKDVKAGDNIMIDDGNLCVRVIEVKGNEIIAEVVHGGKLKSRKGMNLPDTNISEGSLTAKDKRDLEFGLEAGVNWVALSFVRTPQDIMTVKDIIKSKGSDAKIVAKIERPEAITNFDEILKVTDAVMVARGDLGVEIKFEDVPMIQKEIIRKCNKAGKPVIVATQMMESMITNPRPTRAEVNDVANAVTDGADAVMLSAESAAGDYPVETVQAMVRILSAVERQTQDIYNKTYDFDPAKDSYAGNLIAQSAAAISKDLEAKCIIGLTQSGFTASRISRHRPDTNIFIFSSDKKLAATLNLVWGVRAFHLLPKESSTETFKEAEAILVQKGFLAKGDRYVNIAALPLSVSGKTNSLKIDIVD